MSMVVTRAAPMADGWVHHSAERMAARSVFPKAGYWGARTVANSGRNWAGPMAESMVVRKAAHSAEQMVGWWVVHSEQQTADSMAGSMAVSTVDHLVAHWDSKTAAWKVDWMVESLAGLRAACWAGQMAERLACLKVAPKGMQKAGSSVVPMVVPKDCMMAVGMADWTAGKTANSTVGQMVVKLVAMSVAEKVA